jgi:ergothioneine biosynthesis protein EgtB
MGSTATARTAAIDRRGLMEWYRRNRERSKAIFDLITDDAYYEQPIALRHPIVFYEGHLPAFSFNTLVKRGLGQATIDPRFESLFARGIDPHESTAQSPDHARGGWPTRAALQQFADEADRRVLDALAHADLDQPGHPLMQRAEAAFAILEHEAMHQETLLYMWHRLPLHHKHRPDRYAPKVDAPAPRQEWIRVPAGRAMLGRNRTEVDFSWDNERPAASAAVNEFEIERHNVTNAAFLEFVEAGGYTNERLWRADDWAWLQCESIRHPLFWELRDGVWFWRGMFDRVPLPASWPVYVSQAEASAYAQWRGARLPTEAEFQRAAYGSAHGEQQYPWGNEPPAAAHGAFDFSTWDPHPAGSHEAGRSAWGVDDLVGNGWEWTSTVFAPFAGFTPIPSYPEYSADFFDGEHFVMKGASPATARELLRPSFRNWFRGRYPYVYATFRCARDSRRSLAA